MTVLTLVDTPESAEVRGMRAVDMSERLNKHEIQAELNDVLKFATGAHLLEPDQAMMLASSQIARMTELHILIIRVEHVQRELKSVRTQEVDYIMEMLRDVWKTASRMITVRGLDQALTR
jgi:hypothetical protein